MSPSTTQERTYNDIPISAILHPFSDQPELVERIAHRRIPAPAIAIVEPDPAWPSHFKFFKARIESALAPASPHSAIAQQKSHERDDATASSQSQSPITVLTINHIGSTSIPSLPAKPIIDIDLVLSSLTPEHLYVLQLELAGFRFLLREPAWHGHRFFVWDAEEPIACNLHVWGPRCPEVERHVIFRNYLRSEGEEGRRDREIYRRAKREAAEWVRGEQGEGEGKRGVAEYNLRKEEVVRGILRRAFASVGLLDGEEMKEKQHLKT